MYGTVAQLLQQCAVVYNLRHIEWSFRVNVAASGVQRLSVATAAAVDVIILVMPPKANIDRTHAGRPLRTRIIQKEP